MGFKSFISFGLINGLVFLAFAAISMGCQSKNFEANGYFSSINLNSRTPASQIQKSKLILKFQKWQDPKQILLYCSVKSDNEKSCYKKNLSLKMKEFSNQFGPFSNLELSELKISNDILKVKLELNEIRSHISLKIAESLDEKVINRDSFCEKHSKIDLKRCLEQFVDRDSISLLNKFQDKHHKLNAHEYLYSKKIIRDQLEQKLNQIFEKKQPVKI